MQRIRKIVVCTDTHGDQQDPKAVRLFHEFCRDYKPDLRLHLGDYVNAEAFRTGAGEHERRVGLKADLDAAFEFLDTFKPTHLLDGNHDDRLPLYVRHSPGPLADYVRGTLDQLAVLTGRMKTVRLPYDKRRGVIQIGNLKALHGFFCGVNAPQMHARAFGSCIFGHTHRFSAVSVPGAHSGGRAVARGVGCLCHLDLEYNARQVDTLAQAQGWAYGVTDSAGRYWLNNAEVVDGKVAVFESFKLLG